MSEELKPCPFCGDRLKSDGPDSDFYTHPKSECHFSEWEFPCMSGDNLEKWNRRAASTRTASDTRTAAGEAECDAALGRAAPASQHDAAGEVLDEVRIVELAEAWAMTSHAYQSTPLNHCVDFARAIEAELASRGAAQGRITHPESVAPNSPKNAIKTAETRMDAGFDRGAEVDVEAERKLYLKAFPSFLGHGWTSRQEDEFKVWLAARTQADAGAATQIAEGQ